MGNSDYLLAMAGRKAKARRRAALAPLREAVAKASEPTLVGVRFASGTASTLAHTSGLSWRDFVGARCSGCAGFTAADVRRVIGGKGDA